MTKILAVYLPQFYENEDNNQWWGKGFTDWESVKKAEKLFWNHEEPKIPLNNDYYDLSQKKTMERQAGLARKYGVDGFCFYHYYFQNGKKELELPAENLLKWKDIDMPYCFNWASESWIRSWSKYEGNVWTEKYENNAEQDKDGNGILVLQDYGDEVTWREHFAYLLPFFKDERYIKIDGKPVFIFYSPNDIKVLAPMVKLWRKLAQGEGFPDLYLIGAHVDVQNECLDASMIYEPRNAINKLNEKGLVTIANGVRCFEYRDFWNEVKTASPICGGKTFFCGATGYDDTPRRGKSGECLINRSPDIFKEGLTTLLKKSKLYDNEFLFINAWNEWGEGMYLEPDERDQYTYLECIMSAVEEAKKGDYENSMRIVEDGRMREEIIRLDYTARKFKDLFHTLDVWLALQQEDRLTFKGILDRNQIKSVAIYGMASIGKHLLSQLQKEEIEVLFGIDQYVGQCGNNFPIYRPEDQWPAVDAIIITAYDVVGIKEKKLAGYQGKIMSVDELLNLMR